MKRLLVFVLVLVVGVVGLGLYLGWFRFSTSSEGSKTNVTLTIDQERIREDAAKAKQRVQEFGQDAKKSTNGEAKKDEGAPPP